MHYSDGGTSTLISLSTAKSIRPSTIAIKPVSLTKHSYVVKVNGQPDSCGVQTLAADGKSFTDLSRSAGKPAEKGTGVYVKQ